MYLVDCIYKEMLQEYIRSLWKYDPNGTGACYHVIKNQTCPAFCHCIQQSHTPFTIKLWIHIHDTSMAPTTTAAEKAVICTMKKSGCSHDEICTALLHHHSLSNWQINWIFKCYAEKKNYDKVGHSTSQPPNLTPHMRRVALPHPANGDARNATELRNEYFPDVSMDTVKSALRIEGRHAYIWTTVPFISEKNLHVRRKWAELRLDWTSSNWRAVNYSDESIFRIFGLDGIEWCWRKPEKWLDPWYTKKKVKYGGEKVTVWRMITAWGVGRLVQIKGNLTKELYCDILEDGILGIYHDLHMDHQSFYFQQNHDHQENHFGHQLNLGNLICDRVT